MSRSRPRLRASTAVLVSVLALGLVASARADVASGPNPLAGKRQFIPCGFLTNANQGWNPWFRAHRAQGRARTLIEKLAKVPTVYSFAGTPANKIRRRMERYMTELDHPPLGGPNCASRFTYSHAEWNAGRPLPLSNPKRRYVGDYPVLAVRSLNYSACKGGANSAIPYRKFIKNFIYHLGRTYKSRTPYAYRDSSPAPGTHWIPYRRREAAVILEPDYLPLIGSGKGCLKRPGARRGLSLIRFAVARLTSLPNVAVYIDAGEDNWLSVRQAVNLLRKAGVAKARGFALNSTHTGTTKANIRYGNRIAARLKRHFVINTAENAHGKLPRRNWRVYKGHRLPVPGSVNTNCNPPNAGLGTQPTTHTASTWADAYLYVSRVGISSNSGNRCGRGPTRNVWWTPQVLLEARRASFAHAFWPPHPL